MLHEKIFIYYYDQSEIVELFIACTGTICFFLTPFQLIKDNAIIILQNMKIQMISTDLLGT